MTRRRRWMHSLVAVVVLALVTAGVVTLVRAVDGAYAGNYALSGYFSRAGEGIHPGSEVSYRGVTVGRVTTITLVGHAARLGMSIEPSFKVPSDAVATVRPKNLFGAEEVDLTFPDPGSGAAPTGSHWLAPGATLRHTAVSDQLGQLFAAADPLLSRVNATNLASTVAELANAAAGQGPQIAASISESSKLATLLADTSAAQIAALRSFSAFNEALAPAAASINAISAYSNQTLPLFNQAASSYQHFLDTLTPLSDNVAQLLASYHPDIVRLLQSGANVSRVLLADTPDIAAMIDHLWRWEYAGAVGIGAKPLPNGSNTVYYKTFIQFSQVNALICSVVAPPIPSMSFLKPLQQALASIGGPINCSGQMAAFDAAQTSGGVTGATAEGSGLARASQLPAAAASSTGAAAQQIYRAIGHPSTAKPTSVRSYLKMLLGGL